MQITSLLFVASLSLFSTVSAQLQPSWTACAQSCLNSQSLGSCPAGDSDCLCSTSSWVSNVNSCLEQSCFPADVTDASDYLNEYCGFTVANDTMPSSTGSAPSSTSTASPSSDDAHHSHAGLIAGVTIAGVIVALILALLVYRQISKRKMDSSPGRMKVWRMVRDGWVDMRNLEGRKGAPPEMAHDLNRQAKAGMDMKTGY